MNDLLAEMASDSGVVADKINHLKEGELDGVARLANEAGALEEKIFDLSLIHI